MSGRHVRLPIDDHEKRNPDERRGLFTRPCISPNNGHSARSTVPHCSTKGQRSGGSGRAATEATAIFNVTTSGAAVYERANNTRTTGGGRLDTTEKLLPAEIYSARLPHTVPGPSRRISLADFAASIGSPAACEPSAREGGAEGGGGKCFIEKNECNVNRGSPNKRGGITSRVEQRGGREISPCTRDAKGEAIDEDREFNWRQLELL